MTTRGDSSVYDPGFSNAAQGGDPLTLKVVIEAKIGNFGNTLKMWGNERGEISAQTVVNALNGLLAQTKEMKENGGEDAVFRVLIDKDILEALMNAASRGVRSIELTSGYHGHHGIVYKVFDALMVWFSYQKVKNPEDGRLVHSYVKEVNSVEQVVQSDATAQSIIKFSEAVLKAVVNNDLTQVYKTYFEGTNAARPGYRAEKIERARQKNATAANTTFRPSPEQTRGLERVKMDMSLGILYTPVLKSMFDLDLAAPDHKVLFRKGADFVLVCLPFFDFVYTQGLLTEPDADYMHHSAVDLIHDLVKKVCDLNRRSTNHNQYDAEVKQVMAMLVLQFTHN